MKIVKNLINNLSLRFRKWKLECRYNELDIEMQCTNMTYEEYCKESELLNILGKDLSMEESK